MHATALPAENEPSGHASHVQVVALSAVPAGQAVYLVRSAELKAPGGFTRHVVEDADGEYCPAGQSKHEPLLARYVPTAHGVQVVKLFELYDPGKHAVHATALPAENEPSGHASHVHEVAFSAVPAGHAV